MGLGLLLPLLAGGNVLFLLEPAEALRDFLLISLATSPLLLFSDSRGTLRPPSAVVVSSLAVLACWWTANLALRASGPHALVEGEGLLAGVVLFTALSIRPVGTKAFRGFLIGLIAGALITAAYGQYQYWLAFPRMAPMVRDPALEPSAPCGEMPASIGIARRRP